MNNLINSIKNFFNKINFSDKYSRWLSIITLIFGLLINFIFGTLSTMIMMFAFGGFMELIRCFVPLKVIKLWKFQIKVYDFKQFRENLKNEEATKLNEWNNNHIYMVVFSILVFLIIKILL